MSRLREILRPEAERRASRYFSSLPFTIGARRVLDLMHDDLDANTRALAVALGLRKDCRWGAESAPRLEWTPTGGWTLRAGGQLWQFWPPVEEYGPDSQGCARLSRIPGIGNVKTRDVMGALRCIWAALEGER